MPARASRAARTRLRPRCDTLPARQGRRRRGSDARAPGYPVAPARGPGVGRLYPRRDQPASPVCARRARSSAWAPGCRPAAPTTSGTTPGLREPDALLRRRRVHRRPPELPGPPRALRAERRRELLPDPPGQGRHVPARRPQLRRAGRRRRLLRDGERLQPRSLRGDGGTVPRLRRLRPEGRRDPDRRGGPPRPSPTTAGRAPGTRSWRASPRRSPATCTPPGQPRPATATCCRSTASTGTRPSPSALGRRPAAHGGGVGICRDLEREPAAARLPLGERRAERLAGLLQRCRLDGRGPLHGRHERDPARQGGLEVARRRRPVGACGSGGQRVGVDHG